MKTVAQLLTQLSDARAVGLVDVPIARVHSDTRSLRAGDLFVALKGERFDAHDFLPQAKAAGAVAALAHQGLASAGLPGVEVPDTRRALGELARLWRAQFPLPLIAVTGSNGKTTVTQMIAAILRAAAGDAAHATQGNFNNDIGVPLTLLRLHAGHRLSVVELGMNHPGEIAELAAIAQPTVALVNNAQREHLEFMSSVEAVARENGSVLSSLPASGVAVFPSDDAFTPLWRGLAGARRTLTFSDNDAAADVQVQSVVWEEGAWQLSIAIDGSVASCSLRIAGRHNVRNALAAAACAFAAGVDLPTIAKGLSVFEPVGGRSRALSLQLPAGAVTLIDDTYNANPDSMRAAVDVLAELPGPRLLVLGDMGEVGDQGLAFHTEVLRYAASRGVDKVHVVGEWMAQAAAALNAAGESAPTLWPDVAQLAAHVVELVNPGAGSPGLRSVLVKGSRFMGMERVVHALAAMDEKAQHNNKDNPHAA
ncbi:UDP-N-acetylmuramoyl-tripeptide--D-alanyl-D-alanine ligase [Hydrogenophaga palleronii]|uniref:UDP-N-acetylmuramoyl-tripeptide--D-alanyl-D-alanine ligase n=1 Tax=Hydrogenophaga palleronii TaxID=65655 RepID=A0ABU1WME6_9BURK|nr:UDP-N-acetylmuramoyl-tripeptide--D-alanyl-D-alanine ligase [Hydrogenophaga palleronii]MDR7150196.1 UDP-N-acetylmuramoyl-tripeptide--D-alanyl-D-alanine ligase [Hydrogenophaga palleronii]